MAFKLPELPYPKDALAPVMSAETLEYHHGKHHAAYVNKLNGMIEGNQYASMSLEDIIKKSHGQASEKGVFNNAAQVWNHTFFWHCLSPSGGGEPTGKAADVIKKSFGSFKDFKEKFSTEAAGRFGSGWAWVVPKGDGIEIVTTQNAETPVQDGTKPLLTLDVWEHAYYIDYRNARPKFIEEFWKIVNWDHFNKQLG